MDVGGGKAGIKFCNPGLGAGVGGFGRGNCEVSAPAGGGFAGAVASSNGETKRSGTGDEDKPTTELSSDRSLPGERRSNPISWSNVPPSSP